MALCMGIALWSFCDAMVQLSISDKSVWMWHELKFLGVLLVPSGFLYFTLIYTNNALMLNKKFLAGLIAMPLIILVSIATNHWTGLFRESHEVIRSAKILYVNTVNGPMFWISAIYTYSSLGSSIILMIQYFKSLPKYYRMQSLIIISAMLLPIIINVGFISGLIDEPYDYTALAFAITGILVYMALFHFKVPEIIPIARNLFIENMKDIIFICDNEDKVIDYNKTAKDIMGRFGHQIQGLSFDIGLSAFVQNVGAKQIQTVPMPIYEVEVAGEVSYYDYKKSPLIDEGHKLGSLKVFRDITDQHLLLKRLEKVATTDSLTGLYNRVYFSEFVDTPEAPFGIIYGGLNSFKFLNESFGSAIGDAFLVKISKGIQTIMPAGSIIGRYGGDEFVIILPCQMNDSCHDLSEGKIIVENIAKSIRNLVSDIHIHSAGVSICVATRIIENADVPVTKLIQDTKKIMDRKKLMESSSSKSALVESLRRTLEASDYETKQHTDRSTQMAITIGEKLGLEEHQVNDLEMLAALHDIGKGAIPDAILLKPGKLTREEFELMKTHTQKGYAIAIASPDLVHIADGILHHHEKWDGSGYPDGLKGKEISIEARITTLVDSYDVMTNARPYKTAMSQKDAINELIRCKGTHFDPNLVDVLIDILEAGS